MKQNSNRSFLSRLGSLSSIIGLILTIVALCITNNYMILLKDGEISIPWLIEHGNTVIFVAVFIPVYLMFAVFMYSKYILKYDAEGLQFEFLRIATATVPFWIIGVVVMLFKQPLPIWGFGLCNLICLGLLKITYESIDAALTMYGLLPKK